MFQLHNMRADSTCVCQFQGPMIRRTLTLRLEEPGVTAFVFHDFLRQWPPQKMTLSRFLKLKSLPLKSCHAAPTITMPAERTTSWCSGGTLRYFHRQNVLVLDEEVCLLTDDRIKVTPRVLRDVSTIDTTTRLFGTEYSLPIGIAPSAMQCLASEMGELDTARAAARMNINMTLSSQSTTSLEDVSRSRKANLPSGRPLPPLWFQIYLTRDLEKSIPLIERAEGLIKTQLRRSLEGRLTTAQWLDTRLWF